MTEEHHDHHHDGNGGAKIARNAILLAVGALITAGGSFTVGRLTNIVDKVEDLAEWRSGAQVIISQRDNVERDVSTALGVLGNHGDELHLLRQAISEVRGVVEATRTELLEVVRAATGDRFRASDWERESETITLHFRAIDAKLDALERRINTLEQDRNP